MLTVTVNTFENIDKKFHNNPRKTLGDTYIHFRGDLLLLHCLYHSGRGDQYFQKIGSRPKLKEDEPIQQSFIACLVQVVNILKQRHFATSSCDHNNQFCQACLQHIQDSMAKILGEIILLLTVMTFYCVTLQKLVKMYYPSVGRHSVNFINNLISPSVTLVKICSQDEKPQFPLFLTVGYI